MNVKSLQKFVLPHKGTYLATLSLRKMASPSMKNYHCYEDTMLQLAGVLLPFM